MPILWLVQCFKAFFQFTCKLRQMILSSVYNCVFLTQREMFLIAHLAWEYTLACTNGMKTSFQYCVEAAKFGIFLLEINMFIIESIFSHNCIKNISGMMP